MRGGGAEGGRALEGARRGRLVDEDGFDGTDRRGGIEGSGEWGKERDSSFPFLFLFVCLFRGQEVVLYEGQRIK